MFLTLLLSLSLAGADQSTNRQPEEPPRFLHDDSVQAVAFAPDGQTLASASIDRSIRLWKTSTGELVRTVGQHEGRILALTYSPDGKTLASTSSDLKVHLWNPAEGKLVRTLNGHTDTIQAVAFSPDGKFLATSALDQSVRLWDADTGKVFRVIEYPDDRAPALSFSPDGKDLLVGFTPVPKVRRYSLATGKVTTEWIVHKHGDLTSLAVAGQFVIAGTANGALLRADLTGKLEPEKIGPPSASGCLTLAASPDGKMFLVGGLRGEIDLLETATLKLIRSFDCQTTGFHVLDQRRSDGMAPVRSVGFTLTAGFLVAGNQAGSLRVWRLIDLIPPKVLTASKLTEKEVAEAWEALTNLDPTQGYLALARLGAYPEQALAFFAERLKPAPAIDEKQVRAWIAQLDDDDFNVREKAHLELRAIRKAAEGILRDALSSKKLPNEAARRVEELLEPLSQPRPEGERLRDQRLVLLLQVLGTPEARKLLERLASGSESSPTTLDARAALDRLDRGR
jgi:dipeptidyl aminopeptidase/acylaminoacyl peptidase